MKSQRSTYPLVVNDQRKVHRITFSTMMATLLSAFNVERGFVYTLKLLLLRPGQLMQLYLWEGRYIVYSPFRLLLVTTALSLFSVYLFDWGEGFQNFQKGVEEGQNMGQLEPNAVQNLVLEWYNLLLWLFIPIMALFSWAFFYKKGYNYAEHLVFQTFHICQLNVLTLVFGMLVPWTSSGPVYFIIIVGSSAYYLFSLLSWIKPKPLPGFLLGLLGYVAGYLVYFFLLSMLIGIILVFSQKYFA